MESTTKYKKYGTRIGEKKMKTIILRTVLCGGVLVGMTSGMTVQADTLDGNTKLSAEVTQGEVNLSIQEEVKYDAQPLSSSVDFGEKLVEFRVTDYSGTTNGYEISAKLLDNDDKRFVTINSDEISETARTVFIAESNTVGINLPELVEVGLQYKGIEKTMTYTTDIEWTLTKATTEQISE